MADEVTLRDTEKSDVPVFFEHQLDVESLRMAAFTAKDPSDREAFEKKWTKILGNERFVKKTILVGGEIVGHAVVFEMDGDFDVTYWIAREHWGRGIAGKALSALLQEVTVRPLYGRAAFDNTASRRVLESNGFVLLDEEETYSNARGEDVKELIFRLS